MRCSTLRPYRSLYSFLGSHQSPHETRVSKPPGLPAEIWKLMRGSFTIKAWNPAVSECIEEKDGDTISPT